MYDYIDACETESTVEYLKSSVVTIVNGTVRIQAMIVSNLFESDLSYRNDGQIENLPLPWEVVTYKFFESDCTDCKTVQMQRWL
jgi:hypothetical protein